MKKGHPTSSTTWKQCRGYRGSAYDQPAHDVPLDGDHFGPGKSQCRVCYRAYAADWRAKRDGRTSGTSTGMGTVRRYAPVLDGVAQLEVLIRRAGYPSVVAAVAEHTVFLHPRTVEQSRGRALFPTVRDFALRGRSGSLPDGRPVMFDDNTSPTDAFLWSAALAKGPDVQFNHVWNAARDRDAYTALWNLGATPAFLAKTTDGLNHPDVTAALRYHAFRLYGFQPAGTGEPVRPEGYASLVWAPHPAPVADLEATLRERMAARPKHRTTLTCREIGWLFSDWRPDPSV